MSRTDPKGYYAILQVAPTASIALIKSAYRHRAMELHPDRNKSSSATAQFQLLTQAFSVLCDTKLRAAYDTQSAVSTSANASTSSATPPLEPVQCSICEKVTAQPRYVVFWEIKSFILITYRSPVQGIFCPVCAEKKAFRATGVTWLLGWWGIPWGPIYSVHAILSNLVGGEKPALVNAKILTHQAIVFAIRKQLPIAIAIARKAKQFTKKLPKSELFRDQLNSDLDKIIKLTPDEIPGMVNHWRLFKRPFYVQAALLVGLTAIFVISAQHGEKAGPHYPAAQNQSQPAPSHLGPRTAPKPAYVRPATAPNGTPWPSAAGYVAHYPRLKTKGYSTVTIDNSQSDSDVFVKIMSTDGLNRIAARVFFIPAFGQFVAQKLTKGNYVIEYQDLSTGRNYRGDTFLLDETRVADGIQYSMESLTLYKVANGNTQLNEIDDAEFAAGAAVGDDSVQQLAHQ
jgi:hypothetical protein